MAFRQFFRLPYTLNLVLFLFLLLSSAALVYTTMENMKSVQDLANESLESIALALSLSSGHSIRSDNPSSLKEMRTIFSDRVVAYALVADRSGKLLFHTNPYLTGAVLARKDVEELFKQGSPGGRRVTLQTGIGAYQYTYPIERADSREVRLRVVLNSLPADRLIARAHQMWWIVGGVLSAFWAVGIFFGWLLTHHIHLQEELARKKHMALIGQMTAVLSHEIRNALGSIKGYTQWVDKKMDPGDSLREPVAMALGGIDRVESLVNELLLYSRDEVYRQERVSLLPLLEESLRSFKDWSGEIIVRGETEAWVLGDKERLYRVFVNVIQNAIQAMGKSGRLEISVEKKGRSWRIGIEDNGPGIPPDEDVELLFMPFHTSRINGTGIGLAYSRKVIEGMGGQIQLSNRTDMTGAVLTIYLMADKEGITRNA